MKYLYTRQLKFILISYDVLDSTEKNCKSAQFPGLWATGPILLVGHHWSSTQPWKCQILVIRPQFEIVGPTLLSWITHEPQIRRKFSQN
jgi:hypothetical protein